MKYEYSASKHGILTDIQAVVVGKELAKIEKAKGAIKTGFVIEAARPQTSHLHQFFTWNKDKAAEKCWKDEAQKLIQSVIITSVERDAEDLEPVRAFVSVSSHDGEKRFRGRAYISTTRAVNDPEYTRQVLQEAFDELTSWKARYEKWKEFTSLFRGVIKELDGVGEKLGATS